MRHKIYNIENGEIYQDGQLLSTVGIINELRRYEVEIAELKGCHATEVNAIKEKYLRLSRIHREMRKTLKAEVAELTTANTLRKATIEQANKKIAELKELPKLPEGTTWYFLLNGERVNPSRQVLENMVLGDILTIEVDHDYPCFL